MNPEDTERMHALRVCEHCQKFEADCVCPPSDTWTKPDAAGFQLTSGALDEIDYDDIPA